MNLASQGLPAGWQSHSIWSVRKVWASNLFNGNKRKLRCWPCPNITTTNAKMTPALIIFSPQCLLFMLTILLNWPTNSDRRYIVARKLEVKNWLNAKKSLPAAALWRWPVIRGHLYRKCIWTPNGDRWVEVAVQTGDQTGGQDKLYCNLNFKIFSGPGNISSKIKQIWRILNHLRLWIAVARHNLKWFKI